MCKYHLNDQPIPSKSVVCYLGMYINSHLKWSDHVKHITAKDCRSLDYLRHTLFASPSTVKSAAYNCLVRPLLEYASPVWYLHTARDIDRLEAIQRRAARWVCGSRWNPHSHNWSKSSTSCLQDLRWPALHTRQSYFTITQVHDIYMTEFLSHSTHISSFQAPILDPIHFHLPHHHLPLTHTVFLFL